MHPTIHCAVLGTVRCPRSVIFWADSHLVGTCENSNETMTQRVALFVTCLVDLFFPEIGEATAQVLESAGIEVTFPEAQTCCGQPAHNSGFRRDTAKLARHFIEVFEDADAIVAPSGSCVTMVRHEYPKLFEPGSEWRRRAEAIARKTYELSQFLVHQIGVTDIGATFHAKVTLHDSCHANHILQVHDEPRLLLNQVRGLQLIEMERSDWCCGFGVTFAVRLPEISTAMMQQKIATASSSGAMILVTGDASCMMHIAGGLRRNHSPVRAIHLAQILASQEQEN